MKPFRIVAFTLIYTLLTLVYFSPNNLLTITPMAFLSLAFGFVTDWAVEELSNYFVSAFKRRKEGSIDLECGTN